MDDYLRLTDEVESELGRYLNALESLAKGKDEESGFFFYQ